MALRYKEQLGQAIRARRLELGLSQKDLAEAAHVREPQTVSRWERGETQPSDLEAVAAALRTSLAALMAGIVAPIRVRQQAGLEPEIAPAASLEERLARIEDLLERVYEQLTGESAGAPAAVPGAVADAVAPLEQAAGSPTPRAHGRSRSPRAASPRRSA